ncbi:hypothetical protein QCJ18_28320 [Bacillus cereus group sp. FL70]
MKLNIEKAKALRNRCGYSQVYVWDYLGYSTRLLVHNLSEVRDNQAYTD